MVEVYRDMCDFPFYDALHPEVEEAWATGRDKALHKVETYRTWVHQAFNGKPPDDDEVVRISGLPQGVNGRVFISYVPDAEASVVRVAGYSLPVEATRARWGMLVIRLKPSAQDGSETT